LAGPAAVDGVHRSSRSALEALAIPYSDVLSFNETQTLMRWLDIVDMRRIMSVNAAQTLIVGEDEAVTPRTPLRVVEGMAGRLPAVDPFRADFCVLAAPPPAAMPFRPRLQEP
jgi:hypothetical protein